MSVVSENHAYVIMVNNDNSMTITHKKRIVHRSKLIDDLWFLVKPEYNGYNMKDFTVVLEYLSPVSHKYRTEFLTNDAAGYNGYLKYTLPFDTNLTAEAGSVEILLTFLLTELNENGKSVQRVRKISGTTIDVVPISAWSDIIPDCALSSLDQRIIKMDAQIKALNEAAIIMSKSKADDLMYNDKNNELQLSSGGMPIGNKVVLNGSYEDDDDHIVDFDKNEDGSDNNNNNNDSSADEEEDGNDIVEF